MKCTVCNNGDLVLFYEGKIRLGKFPNAIDNAKIYRCPVCQVQLFDGQNINYETEEYRELVDSDSSAAAFYKIHDSEQSVRLSFFDISRFRNATFADVGSGAGSFLDLVKGFSKQTIAIEPAKQYHQALKDKGHTVFSYTEDALGQYKDQADLVTCFSVLEHIDEPVAFMAGLFSLCKPGGTVIISTPNSEDWLIDFLPATYRPFFYRVVHKWYFNGYAVKQLAEKVGLKDVTIKYKQRFNLTNTLNWVKEGKPTGHSSPIFSETFESLYQREVEEKGIADYIYMVAKK
jgi:2-polyprenyl-3-methyl-5-hydroxy-6-metoxy-1,4-benzoquinol methylase